MIKNLFVKTRNLTLEQENILREFLKLTEEFERSFGKRKKIKSINFEKKLIVMIFLSFLLSFGVIVNIYLSSGGISEFLWISMFLMFLSVFVLILMEVFILFRSDDVKRLYESLIWAKIKFAEKEEELEKIKNVTDALLNSIPSSSLLIISVMFFSSLVFVFLKDPPQIISYIIGLIMGLAFVYGVFRTIKATFRFRQVVNNFIRSFQKVAGLKEAEQKVN